MSCPHVDLIAEVFGRDITGLILDYLTYDSTLFLCGLCGGITDVRGTKPVSASKERRVELMNDVKSYGQRLNRSFQIDDLRHIRCQHVMPPINHSGVLYEVSIAFDSKGWVAPRGATWRENIGSQLLMIKGRCPVEVTELFHQTCIEMDSQHGFICRCILCKRGQF